MLAGCDWCRLSLSEKANYCGHHITLQRPSWWNEMHGSILVPAFLSFPCADPPVGVLIAPWLGPSEGRALRRSWRITSSFFFFFFPCEASQDKVRLLWHSSVLGWLQSERTALPTCDVREYLFRLMKWTNGCSSEALFSFRNRPKKLKSHKTTVTQPCTKTTKRAEPQVRGHGACLISGLVLHEIWSFFMGSGGVVLTEWVCWGKTHGAALV